MVVKKIEIQDIDSVVNIHLLAFRNFFLSSLGINFLKVYYRSSLKHPDAIAFGLYDCNNCLKGFAFGTLLANGFHKKILLNNFFQFLIPIFLKALFDPKIIVRLFKNLNKGKEFKDDGNYSELLSLAITPEFSGKGYGKLVLDTFEKKVVELGSKKITLTTDYFNNESTIAFYQKRGYKKYYIFDAYPKRKMYKLIKKWNNEEII